MITPRVAGWVATALGGAWMLTVAVQGAIHASRTGSSGVRLPSGDRALAGVAAAALGVVGATAYAVAAVLQVQGRVEPWFASWFSVGIGIVLVLAGTAVTVAGQVAMGESWRAGVDFSERTELVSTGLFGRSRNPIYLGNIIAIGGLATLVPAWLSLIAFVCAVAGSEVQVRLVEEPYLIKTHGDDYRRYASRVGRFLPGFGLGVSL